MKNLPFLLLLCGLLGCTENTTLQNTLPGYYKIVAVWSETQLDLNNTGIKSNDLLLELGLHHTVDGRLASFYSSDSPQWLMEVRPLSTTANDAKLIAINFPDQIIDQTGDGRYYLMLYIPSFIHYSYALKKDMQIELINGNLAHDDHGTLHDLEYLAPGRLKLTLTKRFFDFKDLKWVNADLTVTYEKVEQP